MRISEHFGHTGSRRRRSGSPSPWHTSGNGICCSSRLPKVISCGTDRKSTRLNSSHSQISYAVFCLKKKNTHDYCNLLWLLTELSIYFGRIGNTVSSESMLSLLLTSFLNHQPGFANTVVTHLIAFLL